MNQADRKEFDIIHLKIDDLRNDVIEMRKEMKEAHDKTDATFEWLRKDIFNPKEGLWAETTENTRYRKIFSSKGSRQNFRYGRYNRYCRKGRKRI